MNVSLFQPVPLPLGLNLPVSLEPLFLPVALALTLSVAALPILLPLHSLLAPVRSCRAFHVALVMLTWQYQDFLFLK